MARVPRGSRCAHGWSHTLRVMLTPAQRTELQRWQRCQSLLVARRGRVVLLRADGQTIRTIHERTGMAIRRIFHWLHRFLEHGVAGLRARRPGPVPPSD